MDDYTNICFLSALLGLSWVYFKNCGRKLIIFKDMLKEIGDKAHTPASLRRDRNMRRGDLQKNHFCMVTGLLMSPGRNYAP